MQLTIATPLAFLLGHPLDPCAVSLLPLLLLLIAVEIQALAVEDYEG